jgi:hypothetical protein
MIEIDRESVCAWGVPSGPTHKKQIFSFIKNAEKP